MNKRFYKNFIFHCLYQSMVLKSLKIIYFFINEITLHSMSKKITQLNNLVHVMSP
jgi:hypothetical protein